MQENFGLQSILRALTISPLQLWQLKIYPDRNQTLLQKKQASSSHSLLHDCGLSIYPTLPKQLPLFHCWMSLSRATPSRASKSLCLLGGGEEPNAAAWINSVLRQVLARTLMRMASILLDNLWDAVTERLCELQLLRTWYLQVCTLPTT